MVDEMLQKNARKKPLPKITTTNNDALLVVMKKDGVFKDECIHTSFLREVFRWNTL